MFRDYFGELATGRIGRRRFVLLTLGLIGIALIAMLALVVSVGVASHVFAGDIEEAQTRLAAGLGLPAIAGLVVLGVGVTFANANIVAKRARDTGLPGWPVALVYLVVSGGASQAADGNGSAGIGFLVFILLALIPTGQFARPETAD